MKGRATIFAMENKQFLFIGVIIVALLGFVFIQSRSSGTPQYSLPEGFKIQTVTADDHALGNRTAPVSVVEYSDFECPACALYATVLQDMSKEAAYATTTAFVYRHFPLKQVHINSTYAAEAAEAADQQGKFWEMGELLFAKQNEWSTLENPGDKFLEYARSLGLNEATFVAHYTATSTKEKIENAFATAMALKLDHTPTFFVQEQEVKGNFANIDEFKARVREMIAAAQQQ